MSGSHTERSLAGGCLCGAVRYEARGEPLNVRICHCRLCQKATGQPFFARAIFPSEAVTIEGKTVGFNSTPELERRFCPKCGTGLFAQRLNWPDRMAVTLASLDDPSALPPTMHFWTSSKVAWLKIEDGLPAYPEAPPA